MRDNDGMVDLTKLRQKDRRPCYVLRVAGLPVLYGTHMPPALTTNGITHERRMGLDASGVSFSRRFDENARVVEVGNLEINLSSDELYTADSYDPGKIFGRIGFRGADSFSKITSNVSNTDTSITVADNSSFTSPGVVHVGLESLWVTSKTGTDKLNVSRGILGTFPREHRVSDVVGSYPYATSPLTYFRGRRVLLYEGRVESDGSVSSDLNDYSEVFRGFFAAEPAAAITGRSHQITLEVAPMTAILDKPLPGSSLSAKLHPNLHAFDGRIANKVLVSSATLDGGMFQDVALEQISYLKAGMAESILTRFANDIADFHPRALHFDVPVVGTQTVTLSPQSVTPAGVVGTDEVTGFYPTAKRTEFFAGADLNTPVTIKSKSKVETKVAKVSILGTRLAPQVQNWRPFVAQMFNLQLSSGTISGMNGFLFSVEFDAALGCAYVTPNFHSPVRGVKPKAFIVMGNDPAHVENAIKDLGITGYDGLYEIVSRVADSSTITGYQLETQHIYNGFYDHYREIPFGEDFRAPSTCDPYYLPVEAVGFSTPDGHAQHLEVSSQALIITDGGVTVRTPMANAFFHLGYQFAGSGEEVISDFAEKFVVLDSPLSIPSGATSDVSIKREDDVLAIVRLSDETSVSNDGFSGYQYKINKVIKVADVQTIADIPGEKRHTFTPTISPTDEGIGKLLLKVLISLNGGSKTSGAYDVLGLGAGLSDGTGHSDTFGADIDVESFLGVPNPFAAELFAPVYKEGDTLLQIVEGLLAAVGYTVDIRTDSQGRCRLCAVELSLPNASNVSQSFTTADISDSPTPTSASELQIKNVFKFSSNYDWDGDPLVELKVKDQTSIDLFNEVEEINIELKGVKIDAASAGDAVHVLRPIFSKLRTENSYPRRVFSFEVPTGLLHGLALGDTCTVTHPLLRGSSGLGVVTAPSRVRSIEYDGYAPTGVIELVDYGVSGSSWNMSAAITAIVGGSSNLAFTVKENDHSPTERPTNGETIEDLSGFVVGEWVKIYSAYSFDAAVVTAQITGINTATNTVIVDQSVAALPADSLSLGYIGFIVPVAYNHAKASSNQKDFAYIDRTTST